MNWWTKLGTPQKVLIGTAIGGVAYFGYRWYANKKAAASAASTTTTQDSSIQGEGTTSQGPTTGGMGYFGGGGPVTGGGGPTGGTPGPTGPAGPAGPPGKAPASPPGSKSGSPAVGPTSNPFGLNEQTIAGKQMAEIGVITGSGRFSGRNVGGGAPVYFYIPKGVPGGGQIKTGLTKAQIAALPAGTQIFTPTSYYEDISKTKVQNSGIG